MVIVHSYVKLPEGIYKLLKTLGIGIILRIWEWNGSRLTAVILRNGTNIRETEQSSVNHRTKWAMASIAMLNYQRVNNVSLVG